MVYKIVHDYLNKYKCLILKEDLKFKHIKDIKQLGIDVLRLSDSAGCRNVDLSILLDLPDLKGLQLYTLNKVDFSPLYFLKNLELLHTDTVPLKIFDLSELMNLKHLFLDLNKKYCGFENLKNLTYLNLGRYPEQNLKMLSKLIHLESLQLDSRKLISLKGISALKNLKNLEINLCFYLKNIDDIIFCKQLESIEVHTCKHINSFPKFDFPKLKKLFIENCGEIESLDFLAHQPTLEEFVFIETKIKDENIHILNIFKNLKRRVLPLKYSRILPNIIPESDKIRMGIMKNNRG